MASLDFAPDFGVFRPTFAINGGGVYGPGFQDGFVVGPEIRFDIMPVAGFTIGLKAAYDYQFRNAGWDEGIAWGGRIWAYASETVGGPSPHAGAAGRTHRELPCAYARARRWVSYIGPKKAGGAREHQPLAVIARSCSASGGSLLFSGTE